MIRWLVMIFTGVVVAVGIVHRARQPGPPDIAARLVCVKAMSRAITETVITETCA